MQEARLVAFPNTTAADFAGAEENARERLKVPLLPRILSFSNRDFAPTNPRFLARVLVPDIRHAGSEGRQA